jgi:hypothetical protein
MVNRYIWMMATDSCLPAARKPFVCDNNNIIATCAVPLHPVRSSSSSTNKIVHAWKYYFFPGLLLVEEVANAVQPTTILQACPLTVGS